MGIFANSDEPDEIPQNAVFRHGLHCSLRPKRSSENEMQFN